MKARGLSCAHLRVATAISANCSLVVPYSCMCRVAAIEYALGAPPTPNGASNCAAGNVASSMNPPPRGPRRFRAEKPVSPCVISATLHSPAVIAAAACSTWMTNDEPPVIVLSVYFGTMPRYSQSCVLAMPPTPAVKTPSTSDLSIPASRSAFRAACACIMIGVMFGTMPISSVSSAPTIATLFFNVISCPDYRR